MVKNKQNVLDKCGVFFSWAFCFWFILLQNSFGAKPKLTLLLKVGISFKVDEDNLWTPFIFGLCFSHLRLLSASNEFRLFHLPFLKSYMFFRTAVFNSLEYYFYMKIKQCSMVTIIISHGRTKPVLLWTYRHANSHLTWAEYTEAWCNFKYVF